MADWVVQNRDKIQNAVEMIGKAAEVLAGTVGQLHPILEAIFMVSAEILSNPEGKEARYLTEQFDMVNQKLEGIKDEMDKLGLERRKTTMNKQNFEREAQMISQYEKFQDFVNAKPEYKHKKMEKFLSHYEYTDADLNVDALYNAVMRDTSEEPILTSVVAIEHRSRRAVEDFCARLKKLFVVGIIAVMGYTALKEGIVGEEIVQKWQRQMVEVEKRMKDAVDDCRENFAEQAKLDMEHQLQQKPGSVDIDFTRLLLKSLIKKYDWVSWSIRIFNEKERICFYNWLAGKKYHGKGGGANYFDVLTKNNIKVVITFCVEPKPINKDQIREQIERQSIKKDMMNVAESLSNFLPSCLVHAVSHYKEVVENNNFPEDCYYYEKQRQAYICIHSV